MRIKAMDLVDRDIEQLYNKVSHFDRLVTDSRMVQSGDVFLAIRGERFDGNAFVAMALEKGARLAICSEAPSSVPPEDPRLALVEDTLITLQALARHHRSQLSACTVIAITGSNGKTTTRHLAAALLSQKFKTYATPGNKNNHIGLPLSILQIKPGHEVAVIELGANHPGENALLAGIAQPQHGLITNTGKDHLEGFGDEEGVIRANLELYDYLAQSGGKVWVDQHQPRLVEEAKARGLKAVYYGQGEEMGEERLVSASVVQRFPTLGVRLHLPEEKAITVQTRLFGDFHLQNILAATAMAISMGISTTQIQNALSNFRAADNRTQLIPLGPGGLLILDAYNANPSSMQMAVQSFADMPREGTPKWIILGDMHELGQHEAPEHQQLVHMLQMRATCFDRILLVGERFARLRRSGPVFLPSLEALENYLQAHKTQWRRAKVLVKGSRSMALERAFTEVMPKPNQQA